MAYRREDIEAVRAATDLAELVGEVTKLQRSGRSVMAVCPFHQEKAPSLSVDPARGLYHCFGCGKSGDLFRFVQEIHHLDFNDAVELLARRAGVPLHRDPEAARRKSRREALIGAVEKAVEFYHRRLRQAPDAATARGYLRGRGYGTDQVAAYRLGYSPEGGDELVRSLRDEQIPEEVMLAAGLAARSRSGRLFDRFRDRVMFPIFDVRGDAVGFGARLLGGEGPKYLNSPDSAIYQKSYLLYGLNWAKSEIVRRGMAVVVEGYTDVIALAEAGRPLGVATCGTALGEGPSGPAAALHRAGGAHVRRRRGGGGGQPAGLRAKRPRRPRPAGGAAARRSRPRRPGQRRGDRGHRASHRRLRDRCSSSAS